MLFDTVTYDQWKDRAYALAHTFRENLYWVAPYPTSRTSDRLQVADVFGNILDEDYIKNGKCPDRVVLTNSISGNIIAKMDIWHHTFIIKYKTAKDCDLYKRICEDLGYTVTVFQKAPAEKKINWTKFLKRDHVTWITAEGFQKLKEHEKMIYRLNVHKVFILPCKVKTTDLMDHGLIEFDEFLVREAIHHVVRKGCIEDIYLYKNVINHTHNGGIFSLLNRLPLHALPFRKDRKLIEQSKYHWEKVLYDHLVGSYIRNASDYFEELRHVPPSKHIKKVLRRAPIYNDDFVNYPGTMYDVRAVTDLYLSKGCDKYAKIYFDLMKGRTYD